MMYNGSFRVQTSNGTVSYPISKYKPSGEYYGVGGGYIPTKSDSDQFKVQMDTGTKSLQKWLKIKGLIDDFGDGKLQNRDSFGVIPPDPDTESAYTPSVFDQIFEHSLVTSRIEWDSISGTYSFSNNNLVVQGGDSLTLQKNNISTNTKRPAPFIGCNQNMAYTTGAFEMKMMGSSGHGAAVRINDGTIYSESYYNGSKTNSSSSGPSSQDSFHNGYYINIYDSSGDYIDIRSDGIVATCDHMDGNGNHINFDAGSSVDITLTIEPANTWEFFGFVHNDQ